MSDGIRCMWMRGGTSKGGYFLAEDLPADIGERDALLLRIMGSPDKRQIDGMGGGDPLTSKVAIIRKSAREGVDVDYLFLQVFVDNAQVSDAQNCGNMLAGVGPFAIERGLIRPQHGETRVAIHMDNTGQVAVASVPTPDGQVVFDGMASIDGVPGQHAPIALEFRDIAGSSCGALLPTGKRQDELAGVKCTLIDNGMPCIVLRAEDVGATGYEARDALESDAMLPMRERIEAIRLAAGPLMKLGDVADKSVPKLMLVAPPMAGGAIAVRSFIPHRAHASIGVLGAVTVATACAMEGSVAHPLARLPDGEEKAVRVEHPSGSTDCVLQLDHAGQVASAALIRTARKLMDGHVF